MVDNYRVKRFAKLNLATNLSCKNIEKLKKCVQNCVLNSKKREAHIIKSSLLEVYITAK